MIFYDKSKICTAVSYDSLTYADLKHYLHREHAIELERVEPEQLSVDRDRQYINLIIDSSKRKYVSAFLDDNQLDRFSYIHSTCVMGDLSVAGVFIYPQVIVYPGAVVGKDVIVHAHSIIGHNVKVDQGTFLSGKVSLAGSTSIGKFCWIGMHVAIGDKITIGDDIKIGANTFVRKSISEPGTYYNPSELVKL